jgi:hypothetical protein
MARVVDGLVPVVTVLAGPAGSEKPAPGR